MTEAAPALPEGWALVSQPFESEFFAAPVLQLRIGGDGLDRLESTAAEVAAWAGRTGAGLVMARVPPAEERIAAALTAAGFALVETLVTLECPAPEQAIYPATVRAGGAEEVAECAAIAREAFVFDRYHADRRIAGRIASDIKENWVRNAFAGRADRCFVAEDEGRVAGFLLTLKRDDALVIDLVAVGSGFRGRGVGRALVEAAKARSHEVGAARVRVGTQAANHVSLGLYDAAGFVRRSEMLTFHWVPAKQGAA